MAVAVETAIKELTPRALADEELAPKLTEHGITEDEIREALTAHSDELVPATAAAQEDWDEAAAAAADALERLYAYQSLAWWRRAGRTLERRIGPVYPFTGPQGRDGPDQLQARLDEARKLEAQRRDAWWEAAYAQWVRRQVTALINDYEDPTYHSTLPMAPGSGLAEVFHPEYEVRTPVSTKLTALFAQMPGGSIGLCGFRGAGKTTLIRSVCRTSRGTGPGAPALGFVVSAPVRYEPREFVLYLFGRLCQEILGIRGGRDPQERRFTPDAVTGRNVGRVTLLAAGLLLAGAGGLELAAAATGATVSDLLGAFAAQVTIGAALAVSGLCVLAYLGRGIVPRLLLRWVAPRRDTVSLAPGEDHEHLAPSLDGIDATIRQRASGWLTEIRYQLTYTSGWSGGLNISVAQATASRGTQAEERQRTLPNVIAGYRGLAEAVTGKGIRLYIGIDELDKISSDEDAERFLNEVKAIFGIENCFYLVSVSENAMSTFERRGLPFRDVFDSTFDEIVRFDRFLYPQSRQLLKRRTVIPEPFIALCHCVSGGLPRDLIRTARTLYRLNAEHQLGGSLAGVTQALIGEDLLAKTAASWVELAHNEAEPEATLFKAWLKRASAEPVDGDVLYQACSDLWEQARTWNRASPNGTAEPGRSHDAAPGERERLNSLGLEINAYRYLAATILQFFASQPSDSELRTAADPTAGNASFERLAEARLLFASGPLLAWSLVSDFRGAHAMPALPLPDPCWLSGRAA
jgi:hypothetical protein